MRNQDRKRFHTAVLVLLASILVALLWNFVDANATLYFYDLVTRNKLQQLENKTIWLTGASSGIGAALTCQLVEAGVKHLVLSSRANNGLEQVINQCRDRVDVHKTTFSIVTYDALDFNHEEVVGKALAAAGSIDILILNAGIYQVKPALQTSMEETHKIMAVNFESPVALSNALMKADRWKERGHGQLVVVSSLMGRGSHSLCSTYAASKHALRGYFHSLSTEESSWLRVDMAMPGATDTNLWKTNFDTRVPSNPTVKMSPTRCAHLILTGAVGPHFLFYETWITTQPGLLWVYSAAYVPDLFHWLIHLFGKLRLSKWQEDGSDTLDIPTFVRQMFK